MAGISNIAAALKMSFDTGDRSAWEALMAPDCVNWHNSDKLEFPSKGNPGAGALQSMVEGLEFEVVQDVPFQGGHLIRFIVRGYVPSTRRTIDAHNCVVLQIGDQGITRIDDYVDANFGLAFVPLEAAD